MTNKEFALMYKTYVDALRKKGSNIDATNICPIQCPFCPRQNPEKNRERILKSKDISFSNYKKLIKFSACKCRINYTSQGLIRC